MKTIIQNFFTPTERNRGIPWGLSRSAFLAYLVFASVLIVSPRYFYYAQLASLAKPATYAPSDVVALVNTARVASGLPELKQNEKLAASAEAKLDDMLANQYFAHISPQDKKPWAFFAEQNYPYLAAGENLAINFVSANDAQNAFMNSPTHRANILNSAYADVGVAVGQGDFHGQPSIFIVEHFGRLARAKTVAKPVPSKPAVTPPQPAPVVLGTAPSSAMQNTNRNVLGVENEAAAPAPTPVEGITGQSVSFDTFAHVAAAVMIAIILLSLIFFGLRSGGVPIGIAAQALVFVAIFSSVFFLGVPETSADRITPSAALDIMNTALR